MTCDHPDCTGVHDTRRPYAEWCSATHERRLGRRRERYATEPTHRESEQERKRDQYWSLSGHEHNRKLLRDRRSKARARMQTRLAQEVSDG